MSDCDDVLSCMECGMWDQGRVSILERKPHVFELILERRVRLEISEFRFRVRRV